MALPIGLEKNHYIIAELSKKFTSRWLLDSLLDWGVIVISMLVSIKYNHPLGYVLALFCIGNRQHALALLGHDGTHFSIHKSRKLNDLLSDVLALWPVGLTTSGYRGVHFQHHRHLNSEKDPELMHRSVKVPQWDLPINVEMLLRLSCKDMMGYSASDYWMIVTSAKPEVRLTWRLMILYHMIFTITFILCGLPQIPLLWYGALLTSFMMFFRIRTWFEHQGSEDTHRIHLSNLERILFAPHNSWYHWEHHHYPTVPYIKLKYVREIITGAPIIGLRDLFSLYEKAAPIASGTALRGNSGSMSNSISASEVQKHGGSI